MGPEYKGPHGEALTPITVRELSVAVPLFILAIWFGVYPNTVLKYMDPTIDQQIERLSDWSEAYSLQKSQAANADAATADVQPKEVDTPIIPTSLPIRQQDSAEAILDSSGSLHQNHQLRSTSLALVSEKG